MSLTCAREGIPRARQGVHHHTMRVAASTSPAPRRYARTTCSARSSQGARVVVTHYVVSRYAESRNRFWFGGIPRRCGRFPTWCLHSARAWRACQGSGAHARRVADVMTRCIGRDASAAVPSCMRDARVRRVRGVCRRYVCASCDAGGTVAHWSRARYVVPRNQVTSFGVTMVVRRVRTSRARARGERCARARRGTSGGCAYIVCIHRVSSVDDARLSPNDHLVY